MGCILRRSALLVVVEIDVSSTAPSRCFPQPSLPFIERVRPIMSAIAAARTVAAHVDVTCGHDPRRRRVVMIGDAQGDVVVAKKIEDVVLVPARVPKFEGVAPLGAQQLEEGRKPLAILFEIAAETETASARPCRRADFSRDSISSRLLREVSLRRFQWVMNFDAFHAKTKSSGVCSCPVRTASSVGVR